MSLPFHPSVEPPKGEETPDASTIRERIAHLMAHLPGGACTFCHATSWKPYAWAELTIANVPGGDDRSVIPCIALECNGCGLVVTFNARKAGVLG